MDQAINEGFGEGTDLELNELRKALSVGYGDPSTGGGNALRVESLEATLKVLSFGAQHVKLWNDIVKLDAYSTIEEYNLLSQYGSEGGGFVDGGGLPETEDSTYARATEKVKYVGTTRAVEHPATLVRSVPADLIAQETQNGVLWMLGKIERGLFKGDASIVPQEWNGVESQIINGGGTVIDLRGATLSAADVENAADAIASNYGVPSRLYANNTVLSAFSKAYHSAGRWNEPGNNRRVGTPVTGMSTQAGDVDFVSNVFLRKGGAPAVSANSAKAPNAPTVAVGAPGGTGSKFVAGDAGNYKYQITAVNQYGESAPCALSAAAAITAGLSVALTITDGGGTYGATGYRIYRTDKSAGAGTCVLQHSVARAAISNVYQATTVFTDDNTYIQGTYGATLLDLSAQSMAFKQLSPLIKIPLATIAASIRWMQLLYGTPIVYAPKRNVVFRNVGA